MANWYDTCHFFFLILSLLKSVLKETLRIFKALLGELLGCWFHFYTQKTERIVVTLGPKYRFIFLIFWDKTKKEL